MIIYFFGSVLTGLLFWLGFAPFELWIAPILASISFFSLIAEKNYRARLAISLITGACFFLPLLHWSSSYVGAIPWLILALGETLIFAVISLFPIRRSFSGVLVFASAFTLIEILRMKFPFGGFGWGRLGFTQIESFTGLYPIIGVTGISLLITLSSAIILSSRQIRYSVVVLASVSLLVPTLSVKSGDSIEIVAIQGGVDNLGLAFNDRALSVLQRHIDATPTNLNPDLFIWPENAVDVDPAKNVEAKSRLQNLFDSIESPLLVGVVEQATDGPSNSSVLYDDDGEILSRYTKQDLAPFGEYIPLRRIAVRISPYADQVRDFIPGSQWVTHRVAGHSFRSFICFEILDDDHVRTGANGINFLVAQTNNATFGESSQAAQQLAMTRARALELGRDFAVVSTTGMTAHINRDGQVVERTEQFRPSALVMELDTYSDETLSTRLESRLWALWLLGVLGLGLRRSRSFAR